MLNMTKTCTLYKGIYRICVTKVLDNLVVHISNNKCTTDFTKTN